MVECIYDLDGPDDLPESPEIVEFLCAEPDKPPPEVQDPLEVIDLGTEEDPRPIQISGLLEIDDRAKIICLLQEFKDCFSWHYTEMPGLDATLVEHRMPIKEGYKPVKQAPRRMSKEIEEKVKKEIERLVKAGFIRPTKYVEWLANIVLVLKAITKVVRCCVDYRNINNATPKDEYPMPMADLSIDAVAKHKVLSFMDGNARRAASDRPQAGIDKNEDPQIEDESKEVRVWSESGQLFGIPGSSKRFITNLAGKIQPLTPLLRLKDKENLEWGPPYQKAFDSIKAYLTSPPVLVPPQRGKPLKLYISTSDKSIGSLLAQNNEGGKEQAVYYLSRILIEVETRYSPVERLCLALYFTANKLRHYMLPCHVHIITNTDVIKYMLSKPMLTGRIRKWILALSEFSFQYVPQRAVKGQAIADFLAEYQKSRDEIINIPGTLEVTSVWIPPSKGISGKKEWVQQEIRRVAGLWITPWKLYFDGSYTQKASGAGIVIINPQGVYHYYSFLLDYQGNTNNRAEYEALIIGLEILMDLGAME
ncbi:unnamed protein product [Malus baccata var. baccata]